MSFQIRSSDIKHIYLPTTHPVPTPESPAVEKTKAPFSTITGDRGKLLRKMFERGLINDKGQLLKHVDLPPFTPKMIAALKKYLFQSNRFNIEGAEVENTVYGLIQLIQQDKESNFAGPSVLAMLFDDEYLALVFKKLGIEDLFEHVQGKSWVNKFAEMTIKTRLNLMDFPEAFEKLKKGLGLPKTAFNNISPKRPFFQLPLPEANVRWIWEPTMCRFSRFNLDCPAIPLASLHSADTCRPVNQDDPTKLFDTQNLFDILFGYVGIDNLDQIDDAAAWQGLCVHYTQGYTNKTEALERRLFDWARGQVSYFPNPAATLFNQFKSGFEKKTAPQSDEHWALLFNVYVFLNQFEPDLSVSLPSIESKNPIINQLSPLLSKLPLRTVLAFLDVFTTLALTNKSKLVEETHQGVYQIRLDEHTVLRWKSDFANSQKHLLEVPIDDSLSNELEVLLSLFFKEIPLQQSAQHLVPFTSAIEWVHSESPFFKLLGLLCLDQEINQNSARIYLQTYGELATQVKSPQLKKLLDRKMKLVFGEEMPREAFFSEGWIALLLKLRMQFPGCETLLCNLLDTSAQEADKQYIISFIPSMCLPSPSFVRRLLSKLSKDNPLLIETCISMLEGEQLSPEQVELLLFLRDKQQHFVLQHRSTPNDNDDFSPSSISQSQEIQALTKQEAVEFFSYCYELLLQKKPEKVAELLLEKAEVIKLLLKDPELRELSPANELNVIFKRTFQNLITKCDNISKSGDQKQLNTLPQLTAIARSFSLKYHAHLRNELQDQWLSLILLSGQTLLDEPDSFLTFWKEIEKLKLFPVESQGKPLSIALVFFLQRNESIFTEMLKNHDINSIFQGQVREAISLFDALLSAPKLDYELKDLIISKYLLFKEFAVGRRGTPQYRNTLNEGETFSQLQKEGRLFINLRSSIKDFVNDNNEFDVEKALEGLRDGFIGIAETAGLDFFRSYESIEMNIINFYLKNQKPFEAINAMSLLISLPRSQGYFKGMDSVFKSFMSLIPMLASQPLPRNQPQINRFLFILDTLVVRASEGDIIDFDYLNVSQAFLTCVDALADTPRIKQGFALNAGAALSLGYKRNQISSHLQEWELFKAIFTQLLEYPYQEIAEDLENLFGLIVDGHVKAILPEKYELDFLDFIIQMENKAFAHYREIRTALPQETKDLFGDLTSLITRLLLSNSKHPDIARRLLAFQNITFSLIVNLCDSRGKSIMTELAYHWDVLEGLIDAHHLTEQSYALKTDCLDTIILSVPHSLSAPNRALICEFVRLRLVELIRTNGRDPERKEQLLAFLRRLQAVQSPN